MGRGGCWAPLILGYLKEGYLQTVLGRLPGLPHPGLRPLPIQNLPQNDLKESGSLEEGKGGGGMFGQKVAMRKSCRDQPGLCLP